MITMKLLIGINTCFSAHRHSETEVQKPFTDKLLPFTDKLRPCPSTSNYRRS
jgi:hypothetical protein